MSGSSMTGSVLLGPCSSTGGARGRIALGNAKSSARLLCPPERFHEFSGWTPPMFVTLSTSSVPTQARLL